MQYDYSTEDRNRKEKVTYINWIIAFVHIMSMAGICSLITELQLFLFSFLFFILVLDIGWIQKHQDQLQRFITTSFLEEMLTHLRKMDVLSSTEEKKIKEAGQLQDQVNMLTTTLTSKDSQGSDVVQAFIESSDSQVAQLIINHGKGLEKM